MKRLSKGSIIGIVAPSKPMSEDHDTYLDTFEDYLGQRGFKTVRSQNITAKDKYGASAGTPRQRADDINAFFADDTIDAIWCLQGGETANQVLDLLDYELIKANPKPFMGKSDIDVLHLAINTMTGMIAFHGPDPKIGRGDEMDIEYTKEWFEKRLLEGSKQIEPSEEWVCVRQGNAAGKILGCNLSSMLKLAGTRYFPDFTDSIVLLESYRANAKKLIYQLTQLKMLGVFEKAEGVLVGHFFDFQGGATPEEIVADIVEDLPILKINEFGHYQPHAFFPIGAQLRMDADAGELELMEEFLD